MILVTTAARTFEQFAADYAPAFSSRSLAAARRATAIRP